MLYNYLPAYLLKKEYVNNLICSCIFIKKSQNRFDIIVVYVDDLNFVETFEKLIETKKYILGRNLK